MRSLGRRALVSIGLGWALSACVGQLQYDPAQSGINPLPGGGSGGSTGGTTSPNDDAGASEVPPEVSCPPGFDVLTAVFRDRCGGCHGAAAPTKNLDLVTAGIGVRTVGAISTCNNKPIISTTLMAGAPSGHLLDKLAGPVAGCGVQMPAGGTPLSSTELACVKEWALKAVQAANAGEYP